MYALYRFRKILMIGYALFVPAVASAQQAGSFQVKNPLGDNATFCSLAQSLINAAITIGAPIAVLIIVFIGAKFIFAQGSDTALKRAKDDFLWTIVGIIIFFCAAVIADVLIGTAQQFGVAVPGCSI